MNIDARFEKISKYKDDEGIIIPYRKTADSAGYDFYCAEDTIIFPAVDIGAGFLAKLSNKISANSENKE
uniref:Deoxyuridine 5'-triphosphate nucleotidohydrolase n=1 Tax=Siphoviridae sp. ctxMM9 TaxID=2827973 RepID=A0A8S5T6S4_9CAUD|nr:MAG TPA: deoxyuridine 5'-triphosphate nucleotidohydrolase [Siphoviridae sp. ctxMM9]